VRGIPLASKQDLLRVHEESYVDLIFRLAEEDKPYDIETPVSKEILEAALLVVGGAIACGESIVVDSAYLTMWQFWLSI